ncbi:MAG: ComEC/Rec2 family competence protein [Candidatus Limnocylindrales bacterium]
MVRLSRPAWLAVGAAGAAHAIVQLGLPALSVAALVLALVGVVALAVGRRPAAVTALAVGVLLVAVRTCAGPAAIDHAPSGERAAWIAQVVSVGGTFEGRQRAVLRLEPPGAGRVYARLPRYPVIAPGDTITFTDRLEVAPDDDGFGAYLQRIGVTATVDVRTIAIARPGDDPVESIRRRAGDALSTVITEPEAGLAAGIIVGLRDRVGREVADALTTAGLSHIVAISGWNIAAVAGLIAALLRGWPRRRRSMAIIVAVAAYTVLAGASPSVVRAALMAGAVLVAREGGRPGHAAAALGIAALLMLLADPATVADAGFLLSVAATAGLLAWAAPFTAWMAARVPSSTPTWIVEALGVSLSAQLATLPIVLLAFGRLSLVAPLANLAAAPFVLPAMVVGATALPVGWLVGAGAPDVIGVPVALAGRATFGALIAIGRFASSVPLAAVSLDPPAAIGSAVVASTIVGLVVARRRWHRSVPPILATAVLVEPAADERARASDRVRSQTRRLWLMAMALVVVGGALMVSARPDGRLRVTVLDVGQGDAILVQGDAGSRMLVDGGPDPDRLLSVLDGQLPAWDRRIEVIVLTHPHEDHVAGLALLLERYRVRTVAEVGMRGPGPGYAAFDAALDRLGIDRRRLAAGDRLRLDRTTVDVRWPPPGGVPPEPPDTGTGINNVSAVLDLRFGARRLLLSGDIEEAIDPRLLASGITDGGRLDLLKVAHHGSRTASTEAFLGALRPRVAVVSAGAKNPYGHPTRQALDRLAAVGARVYRTDTDGSVTIDTDGRDLRVRASGGRSRTAIDGARSLVSAASAAAAGAIVTDPTDPLDPAARYRCATPRIGPWSVTRVRERAVAAQSAPSVTPAAPSDALAAVRHAPSPRPAATPARPAADERSDHQPGLLLGRGRLRHRASRAADGRGPGRRGGVDGPDRAQPDEPRDLARGCRRGCGRRRSGSGRAPPRPHRRTPWHGAALRRWDPGHGPPTGVAPAREGESGTPPRASRRRAARQCPGHRRTR